MKIAMVEYPWKIEEMILCRIDLLHAAGVGFVLEMSWLVYDGVCAVLFLGCSEIWIYILVGGSLWSTKQFEVSVCERKGEGKYLRLEILGCRRSR